MVGVLIGIALIGIMVIVIWTAKCLEDNQQDIYDKLMEIEGRLERK